MGAPASMEGRDYCGKLLISWWSAALGAEEDCSLAFKRQGGEEVKGTLPRKHDSPGVASQMYVEMLENPRIGPAAFCFSYGKKREGLSLEEYLHEVIGQLYNDFQDRIDAGMEPE